MTGLLINGAIVPVMGIMVVGPHYTKWAHLSAGDGQPRTTWPQQIILHKTLADDPERVLTGRGPGGHPQRTAEYWDRDPQHSGAHLVVDGNIIACLADLVLFEAYHANQANRFSVGIEHCEEPGGGIYEGVLDNGIELVKTAAPALGIQMQIPRAYSGKPLERFADGGRTLIGIFGHRDVTDRRGRWDPGEELFWRLVAAGAERFDFAAGEDRDVWSKRQRWLNGRGESLTVDGIPGAKTTAALKRAGYQHGIWALGPLPENPFAG